MRMNRTIGGEVKDVRALTCEEHVISAFVLTDFLLIASYLFGLYLFSREETEYLSNLASKVSGFIQGATIDRKESPATHIFLPSFSNAPWPPGGIWVIF